jgi:hypothetical protein
MLSSMVAGVYTSETIGRWFDLGREDSNLVPAGSILLAVTFAADPPATRTRAE